jgi:hypothetical protein
MFVTLPTVPDRAVIEYQNTITFTALSAPQTTFTVLITGIPSNYVVCGTCTRLVTKFTGSTLSSLTCSLAAFVPNTILSDLTYYGMPLELTQNPTSQSFQTSGPANNDLSSHTSTFSPPIGLYYNGPHDVTAYFTAIGANLSSLTAGSVEVTVQIRPI